MTMRASLSFSWTTMRALPSRQTAPNARSSRRSSPGSSGRSVFFDSSGTRDVKIREGKSVARGVEKVPRRPGDREDPRRARAHKLARAANGHDPILILYRSRHKYALLPITYYTTFGARLTGEPRRLRRLRSGTRPLGTTESSYSLVHHLSVRVSRKALLFHEPNSQATSHQSPSGRRVPPRARDVR